MTSTAAATSRRISVVTVDQVLSSVSNVAALIWVAHTLAPEDFGRFSLIVMAYTVAQVAIRSLVSTTVLVHPEEAETRPASILAATSVVGLVTGAVFLAAGLLLLAAGTAFGGPILALAVPMPLLMIQDVGRYLGIARHEAGRAVVLDTLWIVLMGGGFVAIVAMDVASLTWLVLAWAGAGGIAGLWVFVQYGAPNGDRMTWIRERWDFAWRSLVSGVAASGTVLLTGALMTLFSSPLAVAAFRAATLLGAPSTAVQMAVSTSAAADIAREREDEHAFWRHVRNAIVISTAVGVLNLVVLVFLPDVIGEALLGDAWALVAGLMLPISLKVLLMAGQSGLRAALVGRHRMQVAMVTDIVSIVLIGVCMVGGAVLGDAEGALWAMAVGTLVSTVCWWVAMMWKGRGPGPEQPAHDASTGR